MVFVHTGIVPNQKLAPHLKTKRAVSGHINTNSGGDSAAVFHTTAGATLLAINVYTVAQIQGAAFELDVGIDGNDDELVAAEAIAATAADAVVNVPASSFVTTAISATHTVTASVHTADGTGGEIRVAIDYAEAGA
jgi:uncharacterized low-complexity protein